MYLDFFFSLSYGWAVNETYIKEVQFQSDIHLLPSPWYMTKMPPPKKITRRQTSFLR